MPDSKMSPMNLEWYEQNYRPRFDQLVVDAFLFDEERRILVQKRSATRRVYPGYWDVIGGHVETNEPIYTALAREIREESTFELESILSFVHSFEWQHGGQSVGTLQFLCRAQGTFHGEEKKIDEHRWITTADMIDLHPLTPEMTEGLRQAFAQLDRLAT